MKQVDEDIKEAEYFISLGLALEQLKENKEFNLILDYLLNRRTKDVRRQWIKNGNVESERELIGLFSIENELSLIDNLAKQSLIDLKSLKEIQDTEFN